MFFFFVSAKHLCLSTAHWIQLIRKTIETAQPRKSNTFFGFKRKVPGIHQNKPSFLTCFRWCAVSLKWVPSCWIPICFAACCWGRLLERSFVGVCFWHDVQWITKICWSIAGVDLGYEPGNNEVILNCFWTIDKVSGGEVSVLHVLGNLYVPGLSYIIKRQL